MNPGDQLLVAVALARREALGEADPVEPADDPAEREQQLQFELERKRRWLERYKRQQRKLESHENSPYNRD